MHISKLKKNMLSNALLKACKILIQVGTLIGWMQVLCSESGNCFGLLLERNPIDF
jgi:hypothetical protein